MCEAMEKGKRPLLEDESCDAMEKEMRRLSREAMCEAVVKWLRKNEAYVGGNL